MKLLVNVSWISWHVLRELKMNLRMLWHLFVLWAWHFRLWMNSSCTRGEFTPAQLVAALPWSVFRSMHNTAKYIHIIYASFKGINLLIVHSTHTTFFCACRLYFHFLDTKKTWTCFRLIKVISLKNWIFLKNRMHRWK